MLLPSLLPKPVRRIVAVLRGGVSPTIIAISTTLGFTFGLTPGFAGIHALILVLFVLLNVHLALFLISAALAKALCFAAAPLMYHAGVLIRQYLSPLLSLIAKVPVAGATDFSRYSVDTGIVLGPLIGLVLGLIIAQAAIRFRRTWLKLEEGSEAFKKFTTNSFVAIADRILVGRRTKDMRKALEGKSPLLRKAGIALAAIALLICIIFTAAIGDATVGRYASDMMTRANGAQVDLGAVDLSLLKGDLSAADIQVTDPQNPDQNQLFIGRLSADAGLYDISCGRLIADKIELSQVRFDTPRQSPGRVLAHAQEEAPSDADQPKISIEDMKKLETYFKNAQKLKESLAKLRKWLPAPKKKAPGKIPESYLEYLRARALKAPAPRILAKTIVLDDVDMPGEQFGRCRIVITNASDAPQTAGLPISIKIESLEETKTVDVECRFEGLDKPPVIRGAFTGIEVARLQPRMNDQNPVVFKDGAASGTFDGTASGDFIDINARLHIQNFKAASGGKGLFGLDPRQVTDVLEVLNNIDTALRFVGPTTSPSIVFDTKGLSQQFQNALVDAGKKRLEKEINNKLQKQLDGKIPDQLKDVIKKPEDLIKDIGGILGGKKK